MVLRCASPEEQSQAGPSITVPRASHIRHWGVPNGHLKAISGKTDFLLNGAGNGSMHSKLLGSINPRPLLILTSFSTDKKKIPSYESYKQPTLFLFHKGGQHLHPCEFLKAESLQAAHLVHAPKKPTQGHEEHHFQSPLCYFKRIILDKKTREAEAALRGCND